MNNCYVCQNELTEVNSCPSTVKRGHGACRSCKASYDRSYKQENKEAFRLLYARNWTRYRLKQALKLSTPLINGWPDCSLIEVKIGGDVLSMGQLRRFAWLEKFHRKRVIIRISPSHYQCCVKQNFRDLSVKKYLQMLDGVRNKHVWSNTSLVTLWEKLVKQIKAETADDSQMPALRSLN